MKTNSVSSNAEMMTMWDDSNTIDPYNISINSHKKAYWKCPLGHIWFAQITSISHGTRCPYCTRKKILCGFNDLVTTHPDIAKYWDDEHNGNLHAYQVSAGMKRKVWWHCNHGYKHSYQRRISDECFKHHDCGVCSGKFVDANTNSVWAVDKDLLPYWDDIVSPKTLTYSSRHLIHWKCPACAYQWTSTVNTMREYMIRYPDKSICPRCSQRIIKNLSCYGLNMADIHPELACIYSSRNRKRLSDYHSVDSSDDILWICEHGHTYTRTLEQQLSLKIACPQCAYNDFIATKSLATKFPELLKEWDDDMNPYEISYNSAKVVQWKCEHGHTWSTPVYQRARKGGGSGCPQCSNSIMHSSAEDEIADYIEHNLCMTIIRDDRNIISPKELDVYVPSKHIAVEYNGLYYHNENMGCDRHYHYDKWRSCKDKSIQLITIWEDDYARNPELIRTMIAHKLGVDDSRRVFARKTTIVEDTAEHAREFLNTYHIQGYVPATHYLGAYDRDNKPVAMLTLKMQGDNHDIADITRYATSANVIGGFTKLLSHAIKLYHPKSFITFSDHMVSDGGLYEHNGFIADKEIKPDYMYLVDKKRVHKFNYRLKRFRNDPALKYEDGLSERRLAKLNNIPRLWDAGKTRWIMNVQ